MKLLLFASLLASIGLSATPTVGPITPTPASITAGTSTSVTFSLHITGGTPIANGVNLLQEDSSGNVLSILGVMSDMGNGNFQLTLPFTPPQGTTALSFQASAAFPGMLQRVKSAILTLPVTAPSPTITLNPTSLIFGTQVVGTTSVAQSFTITAGSQPVTINSLTTSGDFSISSNNCGAGLIANAACTVGITFTPTANGTRTSSVVITDNASGSPQSVGLTGTGGTTATPTITSVTPNSGPIGTVVTLTLNNFNPGAGAVPQVILAAQSGGTISAPISSFSAASVSFVVPAGAATGIVNLSFGSQSAASSSPFTVSTSSTFTLNVLPSTANLIRGQSVTYAVALASTNGFNGLATLGVSGLPAGVQSTFNPLAITAGQTATLTLAAPSTQPISTSTLSISASANVEGQAVSQSAMASLQVTGATTTFLGRTVVDDAQETPIAGVTVKFLGKDPQGNATGCSAQTMSDAAGNFSLTNLPQNCTGPQLISYDGSTATAPTGKYAGVNLFYPLTASQATTSPVLIHLPRIDNAETVQVQQDSPTDQVFYFQTIPGLKVTVYAHTKLSLDDGSQPTPFPLIAISIPLDRLPDAIPTTGMLTPFIVAFQPANASSNQPVSVDFPNVLNTAPGTSVTFVTLDPTRGSMVPYGTGTVTNDGTAFTADADPTHPGHGYGLIHFDWHGPMPSPPSGINPSPEGTGQAGSPNPGGCNVGCPIDVSSGIVHYTSTDIEIAGGRGSISINRYYRTLATYQGPFGIGTGHNYSYALNTYPFVQGQGIVILVMPDGNQFTLSRASDGTFVNTTIPALRGAVLTTSGVAGPYNLRWFNGSQYQFTVFASLGSREAFLTSITDLNGNTVSLSLNPGAPQQILAVTDPVGRTLNLTYDSSSRITQITDPIGRKVKYSYNPQGTIATFTDANGGITSYTYDAANYLISITDPRGVVTEQNTYNEGFDGRIVKQVEADGGIFQFSYTLLGSLVAEVVGVPSTVPPNSPVATTVVTDPLGQKTTYRFDPQGFLLSATDPLGQTRTLTRDAGHNNLVSAYTGVGVCPVCGNPRAGNVSFTFDEIGNTLSRTDALGNTTTFTYDTRSNKVNSLTDPLKNTTRLAYDSSGNPLTITDANGNATQLTYDAFGDLVLITDPIGAKTAVTFDQYGNISSVVDALGNTSTLTYDAASRLTRVVDALGRNNTAVYDSLNRLTSLTDPRGNTTSFTYDPIGNLLSFKDARGNSTQYAYDIAGRVQTHTSPLGKTESYKYDLDSKLVQYTDRRGQVSTFNYDSLNRLQQETYSDATVVRSYDANSRLVAVKDSAGGAFGFTYDARGLLVAQEEPTGTVQYIRDALGRMLRIKRSASLPFNIHMTLKETCLPRQHQQSASPISTTRAIFHSLSLAPMGS